MILTVLSCCKGDDTFRQFEKMEIETSKIVDMGSDDKSIVDAVKTAESLTADVRSGEEDMDRKGIRIIV